MPSDEERRKVAARLRREGEMWRAYFGGYTISDMPDHIFTDSVLEAFGPDDMKTKVYKILEKMADLVDPRRGSGPCVGEGRRAADAEDD